jgi:hypothetical protein
VILLFELENRRGGRVRPLYLMFYYEILGWFVVEGQRLSVSDIKLLLNSRRGKPKPIRIRGTLTFLVSLTARLEKRFRLAFKIWRDRGNVFFAWRAEL